MEPASVLARMQPYKNHCLYSKKDIQRGYTESIPPWRIRGWKQRQTVDKNTSEKMLLAARVGRSANVTGDSICSLKNVMPALAFWSEVQTWVCIQCFLSGKFRTTPSVCAQTFVLEKVVQCSYLYLEYSFAVLSLQIFRLWGIFMQDVTCEWGWENTSAPEGGWTVTCQLYSWGSEAKQWFKPQFLKCGTIASCVLGLSALIFSLSQWF